LAAEIVSAERRAFLDGPGQEAFAQGTEGYEADPEFFQRWQDFRLRLAPPQRVFALQGSHRLHRVSAADGLDASFGQSEVLDLAFGDKVFEGPGHSLDRYVGINPVLVQQVAHVGAQALERPFDSQADMLGLAVEDVLFVVVAEGETEL